MWSKPAFTYFHDRLYVTLRIRPADDLLRDGVFGDELGHVLEVRGQRQLPRKRALHGHGRPDSMRSPPCGLLVLGPADGQASVPGLAMATGFVEDLYEIALWTRRDEPIASSSGQFRAAGTADGDEQERRLLRQCVEPRVLDRVIPPVMTLVAAFPEQPDDGDGLLEALLPYLGLRPAGSEDVLVEVLARADAEKEAPFHHRRRGGGGVGDDGRMHAHGRAGHPRPELEPLGGVRDGADHGPHEWALALRVRPGMKMVRDVGEGEPVLLGHLGVLHEVVRPVLFARQLISDAKPPSRLLIA
jgi:hypothetical protein